MIVDGKNSGIKKLKSMAKKYTGKKQLGYEYDRETRTIFVYGKGEMKYKGEAPWISVTKNAPFYLPENIVVCNGLTSIADEAFSDGIEGNTGNGRNGLFELKNVVIANTVKSIGEYAFYNCNALENVVIPNSVKVIGKSAFEDCDKLDNITIPGSVKKISEKLFLACRGMESVTIENGVEVISADAFHATKLKSLVIPESISTVESGAFAYTEFNVVEIPDSVVKIGEEAFGYNADAGTDYKIKNFTIKGYKGTAAEKYAEDNGFKFVALKE